MSGRRLRLHQVDGVIGRRATRRPGERAVGAVCCTYFSCNLYNTIVDSNNDLLAIQVTLELLLPVVWQEINFLRSVGSLYRYLILGPYYIFEAGVLFLQVAADVDPP